ncbi:MAG: helix-turn-helix transcriptional regulator [Bacteroidales bacterium]|nr:helix-turn-helix transcriptional regulator [Bacteroidales bacterium]
MEKLLSAVTKNMSDEEATLSAIQSMISAEIIGRRIDLDMTQKDLSRLLDVSQSTLSKWESGETNFTLSTLVSIASKLNIEMQSPFVPTPPKYYQPHFSNIIAFNPKGWSIASSKAFIQDTKTETESSLKEM